MRIWVNGKHQETAATTVAALLEELGVTGPRVAVEVNQEIVPRSQHERCVLTDADHVEIVGAVGGG